jgi:hypothetical protein
MSNKQFTLSGTVSPNSRQSPTHKSKTPLQFTTAPIEPSIISPSPIKILLQNNIKLNMGKDGIRSPQ